MAELKTGDKVSVGDAEGVVVRAVATAEGVELTLRLIDEENERPISAPLTQEKVDADQAEAEEEQRKADKDQAAEEHKADEDARSRTAARSRATARKDEK